MTVLTTITATTRTRHQVPATAALDSDDKTIVAPSYGTLQPVRHDVTTKIDLNDDNDDCSYDQDPTQVSATATVDNSGDA